MSGVTGAQAQTISYGSDQDRTTPIVLNSNSTILDVSATANRATQSGAISGGYRYTKTGEGTLVLTGENSNDGILLNEGGLAAYSDNALGVGGLTMADGTRLEYGDTVNIANTISIAGEAEFLVGSEHIATQSGDIHGSGTLVMSGGGQLNLSGSNTYTGGTRINGGSRLHVLDNNALGSGTLQINTSYLSLGDVMVSNDLEIIGVGVIEATDGTEAHYMGNISGGALLINGLDGRLTLWGDNSHNYTTVAGGTIRVEHNNALGAGTARLSGQSTLSIADQLVIGNDIEIERDTKFHVGVDQHAGIDGNITSASGIGAIGLVKTGEGALTLSGTNSYHGNTVVREGTLGFITANSFSNNGLLVIEEEGTAIFGAHHRVDWLSGSGTLNIGSNGITVGQGGFSGSISGSGTFEIDARGQYFSFTGDGTGLTGQIYVRSGVLNVSGELGDLDGDYGGLLTVEGAGWLEGRGRVGDVLVTNNGYMRNSRGQTLSMRSLTLDDGARIGALLGGGSSSPGLFSIENDLVLDGTLEVYNTHGDIGPGVYRLMDYGGTLTDNGLDIGIVPNGADPSTYTVQTSVNGQINLAVVAPEERLFWDGDGAGNADNGVIDGGSGTWRIDSTNFTTVDGSSNGVMAPRPGFVIFQGGMGLVDVDNSAGDVTVTGMQFASNNYMVRGEAITLVGDEAIIRVGDGSPAGEDIGAIIASDIRGSARLVKTDLGDLLLRGNNTYTGGTEIREGSITVINSLALQGDVVNNSRVIYNATDQDLSVRATISGTGSLEKVGNGELEILTHQSYTGGTIIREGVLRTQARNIAGPIQNDATLTFDQSDDRGFFAGAISGTGGLIKTGTEDLTLMGETTYTGQTQIREGSLRVTHSEGLRGDVLNEGTLVYDSVSHQTVTATISGSGDFVKSGRSVLQMFGEHSYTGTTFVNEGTLATRGNSIRGPIVNSAVLQFDQVAGGSHSGNVEGYGRLEKTGAGDLTLSGVNTYHGSTHVRQGRLGFITANSLSGNSDLIIDGGAIALFGAAHNIGALEGEGTLDIGVNGVFVGTKDRSTTFAGAVTGTGVFEKVGTGNLTLTGDSSGLAGSVVVRDGTLEVQGQLGGSGTAISVAGGILRGTGSLGEVSVDGGTLLGIQGQTLTMESLTLGSQGNMEVHLGMADGSGALFDVAGDLTLDGLLHIVDMGGFGPGIYNLINYGGTLTDNGLDIGAAPAGVDPAGLVIQTSVDGEVNLANVAPDQRLFWDGDAAGNANNGRVDGGAGVWRADSANFTNIVGTDNGAMAPNPGFVIFQSAGGSVVIENAAGAVAVTGMQFAADGYVLSGDTLALSGDDAIIRVGNGSAAGAQYVAEIAANLGGSAKLIKTDLGELILSGDNSYTGGTEIRQGALRITNTQALRGNVTNDARLIYDTDTELSVIATVSGRGALIKDGSGVLEVFGRHSYTGGTIIQDGTLVTRAGNIVGDILNDAVLQFDQLENGTFAGNIGGNGALVKTGTGNLILRGASGYEGGTRVLEGGLYGTTEALRGDIEIATGARLGFEAIEDGTYAGSLSGAGGVAVDGEGTTRFTGDSSGFTGHTDVTEGMLVVDGSLGGLVSIADGGRVGGSGTIGSTVVMAGGVLSPGNSIGTLTINGDLTFESGARFEAEVNPDGNDSDLLRVTGDASLNGGSVLHIGANGNYDPLSVYRILTAEGALSGEFDEVSSNFAFLTPDLIYDHDNGTVDLELERNEVGFTQRAVTANERAAAAGIESLGMGNAVYDAIVTLPDQAALIRNSFNQLSGEIHSSLQTSLLMDNRFLRSAVTSRLHSAFAGGNPSDVIYTDGGFDISSPDRQGITFWSEGFGSWGHVDGSANAARLTRNTGGFIAGADAAFDDWRFGMVGAYSNTSISIGERNASASSDNYHIGAYAGAQWGGLSFKSGLTYTWHDISTSRSVRFAAFDEKLTSDYDAHTFQAFGELGYRFDYGSSVIEPFVNLAHVHLNSDRYLESGGAAALTGSGNTQDATFTTLGLRASHTLIADGIKVRLHGMAAWQHAFGASAATASHSMAGGSSFTVLGVPMDRDTAVLEGGMSFLLGGATQLGFAYTGQFMGGEDDHSIKANLEVRF